MDIDSYRMKLKATRSIGLGQKPEMDRLSNIIAQFNETWGGKFSNQERVLEVINQMPGQILEDEAYRNAKMNSDKQNAQIEHDRVLQGIRQEPRREYARNPEFRASLNDTLFRATH